MKRTTFRIKIWVSLAITTASLVLASGASALTNARAESGGAVAPQVPVVNTPSGFNWADAAIGAAIALATVLAAIAVAHLARNRNRSRLAASH